MGEAEVVAQAGSRIVRRRQKAEGRRQQKNIVVLFLVFCFLLTAFCLLKLFII
jgi:hypothetical protein